MKQHSLVTGFSCAKVVNLILIKFNVQVECENCFGYIKCNVIPKFILLFI
jgi:hypothetical protein